MSDSCSRATGHFHADEALAVYLLRMLPAYSSSPLVRTRDPEQLASCHTVVDVGGEYDPARNRYDHHQRTFQDTFPNHTTRLSSAGLVYLHFGKAIIAQHMSKPIDHEDVQTIYEKLYADFIEALDAHDNGISVYEPQALAASGLEKRFRDGGINLGSLIGDMNLPDPNDRLDEDSLFANASTFIGETFARKLRAAVSSWLPARETVRAAYESRFDVHSSGRIIILSKGGVPWKEHLYNLEQAAPGMPTTTPSDVPMLGKEVYYVIYPESTDPAANWRIQCVPTDASSFESRKPLPAPWRGVRDQDLDGVLAAETETKNLSPIPAGAIFAHASGFIGGHKTKEGVLAMADRSLQYN
ncbi:MYG1 protein [Uncinocarpus reesii 1704]|uniref:MYG1 protein n=1 Tax=Uncinocarpus reesii (strain UAMH 1704) TaxID=336963 RepID=C4JTD7_UNCRE|nr:MYG1 protein [Uncinocarpus reesii 1704]EEP80884.1 MYG1 protein [Uncinocarpus reesii 1704]